MTAAIGATSIRADQWVFVGTYTTGTSKGIYAWRMDAAGRLSLGGLAAELPNPTYLALHPNGRILYAVSEVAEYEGRSSGSVSAFAIDHQTGSLRLLNAQPTGGAGPCHLTVDNLGRSLAVANYRGGSVATFPLCKDGSIGELVSLVQHAGSSVHPARQAGPHAHGVTFSPGNRFILACDLGLDKVLVYACGDGRTRLSPHAPAFAPVSPGAGPRHLVFHPNGGFAYVINELNCTITVTAWSEDTGALREVQTVSTLPAAWAQGFSAAEIGFDVSGRFVYVSNRGSDNLGVFACDPSTGQLTLIGHTDSGGRKPRHFAFDATGNYLLVAHQADDSIRVFRINEGNGMPVMTDQKAGLAAPVCVLFVPVESPASPGGIGAKESVR